MKPKMTESDIRAAMFGESFEGICTECGATQGGCEPDARHYKCEACGALSVFGMEQAVLENLVEIVADGDL
jgi:hypothetical protein